MKKERLTTEQERDVLSVIRYPKWCLYLGIVGGGFSLFMTALFLLGPDHIFTDPDYEVRVAVSILFILLIIWAVWLILLQLNWKIEVKEDRFVFTNTFKKRREYKFDEIEERQLRACYRYYHNGKHIVCISMLLDDFYMLSEAIAAYRAKKKKEGEIQ